MATTYTPVRKKNAGVIAKEAALDVNSTSSVTGKVRGLGRHGRRLHLHEAVIAPR